METAKKYLLLLAPFTLALFLIIGCDDTEGEKEEEETSYIVSISANQLSLTEGTDDTAEITIRLDQENETDGPISIKYNQAGSAESGDDFNALSGEIEIADGQQSTSFGLVLIDDDEVESNETLDITLSSALADNISLAANGSTISFTFLDDDSDAIVETYELSVTSSIVTIEEGSSDVLTVTFSLDKQNTSDSDIQVDFVQSGSADSGSDFTTTPGPATIAIGETTASMVFEITDDDIVEEDETLTLTLRNPSAEGVSLGTNNSITLTITDNDEQVTTPSNDISILASKFYHTDAVTVTFDDTWVTITSKVLPDHKSMYYATDNELYEAYDEPDNDEFKKNPGEIEEQNIVFKLPRYPTEATNKESPGGGAMGVAINSVVFFNQEAAPGDDIFDELNTFDQYEGHPAGATYHYHIEPIWLTELKGSDAFMGFLLDGFPVYGTHENSVEITNDDLDDYHGHYGETADFPDGIYHYHITVDYPWINGDAYYGEAGTRTE